MLVLTYYILNNADQWSSWIEHSHNNLRISRILTCLKDFGLNKVANDFMQFLKSEAGKENGETIQNQVFIPFNDQTRRSCLDHWPRCLENAGKGIAFYENFVKPIIDKPLRKPA